MGSELIARGFPPGGCPEEWNVARPAEVIAVHSRLLRGGADIVNTNTFGGSSLKLAAHGMGDRAVEFCTAGAGLAVALRDREFPGRLVAGDIGACGHLLAPVGTAAPGRGRRHILEQAQALVAAGVDLLDVETMFDLTEARLAVEAACAAAGGRPVLVSMAFKPAAKGYRTMMGVIPEVATEALRTRAPTSSAATARSPPSRWPIWSPVGRARRRAEDAQPNAGQPHLEAGETVYAETAEHFAAVVAAYPSLGARVVGGCCGTPPASIAALAAALGR